MIRICKNIKQQISKKRSLLCIKRLPKFPFRLSLWLTCSCTTYSGAQIAKGANKFLGNITTSFEIRPDFITYWNQITGENELKWEFVEETRDIMDWSKAD